ncbi:Tyrosine decarboxylase 1 [Phytophthora cactorum]|uniref:Tyrosine decarboxylase 1 n=6 Tax=Phytophthora cactorum TaxID=29920 RepID=A0A329RHD8_9STRA|nr:Tyrosine decarboxylase 1 [Phytophthora cactorum]RAW24047.1 Tyrosine decarboxylase 1 [Phytophthora cactorum]
MPDSISTAAAFCSGLAGGAALLAAFQHLARRRTLESTRPLDVQDPEAIRHPAAALTELLVRYHENLQRRDPHRGEPGNISYSVRSKVKPGELRDQLPTGCPEDPQSYAEIFRDVEQLIFPALTHWASPNFHAYFKICGSDPSVLADYLCSSLDVIGFSWVSAPAATELEQVVCDWMAKLLGLPECFLTSSPGGGVIQGSASESALCALIAARHAALEGLEGAEREEKAAKLVVYVSDQTHAIAEKGCMVLDIPHLRVVPTIRGKADSDNYGLAPDDVARAMVEDRAKGLVPFCLMPTLGTTSTTAIDPLRKLVAVAREQPEHVWVHLDGAYGGAAAVCPEYQHWLDGVEGCDSICINTHKWLLVSFDASLLWVKDRGPLVRALALDPEYLKNEFMQSAPNYKDWQVPLGRRFRALKLWFTFRRFGATGLREHIRRSVALAKQAEELLMKDGRFKLFVRARMGLVCFYVAFGGRELNEALLRRVNESGKEFLIHSVVDGVHFLRLAIGGLEVDAWHIENVVTVLSKALTEAVGENPKWQELQRENFASAA